MNILTFDIEEWYMYSLFPKAAGTYWHDAVCCLPAVVGDCVVVRGGIVKGDFNLGIAPLTAIPKRHKP